MVGKAHLGTLLSGILLTVIGAVLLTEGLGWWDLTRDGLRYFVPGVLILVGSAAIARGLSLQSPGSPQPPATSPDGSSARSQPTQRL